MSWVPYIEGLTPEERGRRLVAALRTVPTGEPFQVPGDGEFLWNFGFVVSHEPAEVEKVLSDYNQGHLVPEGWCGTVGCAVGLAQVMGLVPVGMHSTNETAEAFGLEVEDAYNVFFETGIYHRKAYKDVTPGEVADALERALNGEELSDD